MRGWLGAVALAALVVGCDDSGDETPADAGVPAGSRQIAEGNTLRVTVALPADPGPGLRAAGEDLAAVLAQAALGPDAAPAPVVEGDAAVTTPLVVRVELDAAQQAELGDEGYRLGGADGNVLVTAATSVGASHALYRVAADAGARWYHPEEGAVIHKEGATLPGYSTMGTPRFRLRGFHEHTQHPIVMSDVYLRPEPQFRDYASRYIAWLARNRQNAMSFHMLKTVDLDAWLPYITDIIGEAHDRGVKVGMVLSFVDQQQNNYKLLDGPVADAGAPMDEMVLRMQLDRFADAGFDFFAFQIGSSEFTKPEDADVLRWLDVATAHLVERGVEPFTWIHTTCDLEADDGSLFYHLPLRADPRMGAWVHTTMYYDLTHPAPVYGCESFAQQADFIAQADGQRPQVYFPETAWWLGFDNNMPLVMPLTGYSRAWDIQQNLRDTAVEGHITFTTGREWTYWQYDHFLTRITWDDGVDWADYLDWIAPLYGARGDRVSATLQRWTSLQKKHFYDQDPLIYFYLAGELRQDEIGENAGILARRPKPSFVSILNLDDDAYAAWAASDLQMLEAMYDEYAGLLEPLPKPTDDEKGGLYGELYDGLWVYVRRIEHTIALYRGVTAVRGAIAARAAGDEALLMSIQAEVERWRTKAADITTEVVARLQAAEGRYRYPIELLARDKPETLTSYPYGYLSETSTGHFWTRRDAQFADLVADVFETRPEVWGEPAPDPIYLTDGDGVTLTEPNNPVAGNVLTGFMPQMLFGLVGDVDALVVALDHNVNGQPDGGSELRVEGARTDDTWVGQTDAWTLDVRDSTGLRLGELSIVDATFTLGLGAAGPPSVDLQGDILTAELVAIATSIAGLDEDGLTPLLKTIWGLPRDEALPARLPVRFAIALRTE